MGTEVALLVLLIINLFGFGLMGTDKRRAKRKQYRISERTLWFVALFGGATGMTIGMQTFRHKTKHIQFKYGLPVLMLIHFVLAAFIIK